MGFDLQTTVLFCPSWPSEAVQKHWITSTTPPGTKCCGRSPQSLRCGSWSPGHGWRCWHALARTELPSAHAPPLSVIRNSQNRSYTLKLVVIEDRFFSTPHWTYDATVTASLFHISQKLTWRVKMTENLSYLHSCNILTLTCHLVRSLHVPYECWYITHEADQRGSLFLQECGT